MSDELELLKRRFVELAKRAYNSGIFTFTDFLGLAEQAAFAEVSREIFGIEYVKFGGAEGAERVMIRFGSESDLGYSMPFPISLIKVEPLSQKYAEKLSHRDFLGAIMNLGIERDTMGDIVIIDNVGYIFVKEDMATYIAESLERVGGDKVTVRQVKIGEGFASQRRVQRLSDTVASARLDCVVASLANLSRESAQQVIRDGRVELDYRSEERVDRTIVPPATVSVRGVGKFRVLSVGPQTKKGRYRLSAEKYI